MKQLIAACLSLLLLGAATTQPEVKPEDLPRTKPVEAGDALGTMQVRKGFHLELVAAEPLVIDPIAMCFDENGRLFVVEMRDYSERRNEKLGRIRMLESTKGDGKYDKATVFLDHLPWPTAVCCYNGGVLVGACPDIIYAKDTNGDGVADEVKTVFTGFGTTPEKLNVQGLFNNFIWGMDNRIHGCSAEEGGLVSQTLHPERKPIDVRGKGFVIDPRDWSMTTENGGGQYGLSFDPFGRMFTCTNSSHIETFMYDARYAGQNDFYTMPPARKSIAVDGPAAEVFRISQEEAWRVLRTRWRIGGVARGPIEGGGRSSGYFTSASGITIYTGNAFGPEYVGDAFVGEPAQNLIHHKQIWREGLELVARRSDDEKSIEFCASTDNWFRPVDFANAPDGCLYVADMYREIIEHPWSLPPEIKKHLDLNSGNDRGRIYRIARDGFVQPAAPVKLGAATTAELVALLEHPNGWHRQTASRLIFERQDKSKLVKLMHLARESASPVGRLQATWALRGLGFAVDDIAIGAMEDQDFHLRCQGLQWSEVGLLAPEHRQLRAAVGSLVNDPEIAVRFQLALTLGQSPDPERSMLLAEIARRDIGNAWVTAAVLSSSTTCAAELFDALAGDPEFLATKESRAFLSDLVQIIGASSDEERGSRVLAFSRRDEVTPAMAFSVAAGWFRGIERKGRLVDQRSKLAELFERARSVTAGLSRPQDDRIAALQLLAYEEYESVRTALIKPLKEHQALAVQQAALGAMDRFSDARVADDLLGVWSDVKPAGVRSELISVLLHRPERTMRLLEAMKAGKLRQADLDAAQVRLLLRSNDSQVQALARQVLNAPTTQRAAVIESFRPALTMLGDASRGHLIYQQRCVSCHRTGAEGSAVGPDFVTVRNWGREKLLIAIVDPSREVAANYIAYMVETKDGAIVLGIFSNDTPASLTIRQPYGKETTIARPQIRKIGSDGRSLMPDGLELGLTQQNMADLLEFVLTSPAPDSKR